MLLPAAAWAQFVYSEDFTSDVAPGWSFYQVGTNPGARLTAGAAPVAVDPEFGAPEIDPVGDGWLRLTTLNTFQSNAVTLSTKIPSAANTVVFTFDFAIWNTGGPNPADGISFFIYDANATFAPGADGGSLSYAQKTAQPGLPGAYFGVGLDTFGNFSNATEGRTGAYPTGSPNPGSRPNEIAVRGPGSGNTGYYYLAGTGGNNYTEAGAPSIASLGSTNLAFPTYTDRPDQDALDFRRMQIELNDNNELIVRLQAGYASAYLELFTVDLGDFTRPDEIRIGFGGATGGSIQVAEIRNLLVTASGLANTWYWTHAEEDSLWNSVLNWNPSSSAPHTYGDVVLSNAFSTSAKAASTIFLDGGDKTLANLTFTGKYSFTIDPQDAQKLIFDSNGAGPSVLNVLNNPEGNADHRINAGIALANNLQVDNLVDQRLELAGDVDIGSHTLTLRSFGETEVSGDVSGSGALIKRETGLAILSGANSYTGATTVEAGTLQAAHANALGGTGTGTTVQSGASLALSGGISFAAEPLSIAGTGVSGRGALYNAAGDNTWTGAITQAAASTIGNQAGSLLISGGIDGAAHNLTFTNTTTTEAEVLHVNSVISGTSQVTVDGGGSTRFSVDNTYSGQTHVQDGMLIASHGGALGNTAAGTTVHAGGALVVDGVTLVAGESLTVSGDGAANFGVAALAAAGTGQVNGNVTITGGHASFGTVDAGSTLRVAGVISGVNQDAVIAGPGVVEWANAMLYTGDTRIEGGTLRYIGAANRIADTSNVIVSAGANYNLNSFNDTIGSLAGAGNVQLGSATLTAGGNNVDTTFSGVMSGSGNFTKAGTGTMTFAGANTFTGTLTASAGTVALGANNVFANSMPLTLAGGTFAANGYSDTMGLFTLTADSTIDYLGTTGGYLTFADMTRSGGALTIDNWAGSFTGNGATRLQVLDSELGSFGTGPGNLSNITFAGWGGAQLISLGTGVYEIVPQFTGAEWDGSNASNNWDAGTAGVNTNWRTAGNNTDNNIASPSGNGATALFRDLDPNLNGKTISLNGNRTLGSIIFLNQSSQAYTIANNTLTLNSGSSAPVYITAAGNGSPTISSRIVLDSNPLVISNNTSGTLTLSGDYLVMGNNGANSNITVGGSGLTVISSVLRRNWNNTQISNGAVIKNGLGTLRLAGSNLYSGGTTLNAGTIQIGHNSALGTGALTINGGKLEAFTTARTISNAYTVNSSFAVAGANNLTMTAAGTLNAGSHTVTIENAANTTTLSGAISGSGALVKAGAGTLALSNASNAYSGGTTVQAGTLNASTTGALTLAGAGAGSVLGTGAISVTGGTLNASTTGNAAITVAAGSINVSGGELNVSHTATGGARNIAFNGTLTQTGGTSNLLSGYNFTMAANSGLNVSAGTANIAYRNQFSTSGTSGNAAVIQASGSGTINITQAAGTSTFTLGQHDRIRVDGAGAAINIDPVANANAHVNLNGRIETYNGGTLFIDNASGGQVLLAATTIWDGGSSATAGTLKLTGDLSIDEPGLGNQPNLHLAHATDHKITAPNADSSITGLGTVTKTGAGTTTIDPLVNNIAAREIDIQAGTLLLGDADQIANTTNIWLSGGTLGTGGNNEIVASLTLNTDSVIDMGNGASILQFEGLNSTRVDGVLTISNWSGTPDVGGGTDQVIFATSLSGVFLSNIYWSHNGIMGARQLPSGEIVPVPEPAAYIGAALLLGAVLVHHVRRRKAAAMVNG
jgi:autotransporter-associated beta strand protein